VVLNGNELFDPVACEHQRVVRATSQS
jgi:hypothetical protein